MIKTIQSETLLAISATNLGVEEASKGVTKAEVTGGSLEAIMASICSISMEVSHIATAAEEQSSTVHDITGNIHKVTQIIGDSAAGTQQFATAASEMHSMAEELKKIVSGFNVEKAASALLDQPLEESGDHAFRGEGVFSPA